MTTEEACRARIAADELALLYDAYAATSRASRLVLGRIGTALAGQAAGQGAGQRTGGKPADEQARLRQHATLTEQIALSRRAEAVYGLRAAQVRRRIRELTDWEEEA